MLPPRLPAELIDKIFSYLQKDISALKACSKAHPFYSSLAERHLYAEIVVFRKTASDLLNLLNKNSRFLNYPRTLDIRSGFELYPSLSGLSIMALVPRMANLVSLKVSSFPCHFDHYEEFLSTFRNCLQQSPIERLHLSNQFDFPFSLLDTGKTIKTLMLTDCSGQEEPISSVPSSQEPLETLILSGGSVPDFCIWGMLRVTRLTSLGLQDLTSEPLAWMGFPDLLTVCSNSVTTLHIAISRNYSSLNFCDGAGWIDNGPQLLFTLDCALPEIIRLINTAPAIQHVTLSFHCRLAGGIISLGLLDWSLLNLLQPNPAGTRPRIELCITGEGIGGPSFSAENILDALAGSDVLMNLVTRGLVVLKSERPWALWDD